jgi:outer membrane beta-barrel protein
MAGRKLFALLALTVLPAAAFAAEKTSPYEKIKDAVIRKIYSVESTSAFSIQVGAGFGQEYTRDLQFGLSYRYHPSHYIGVGATVLGGLSFESSLVGEIRNARPQSLNSVRPDVMPLAVMVDLHIVPIYGKFVAFGRYQVHYDLSLTVGAGVALVKRKALDGQTNVPEGGMRGSFSPSFGASLRMLFGKRVGLAAEFRDYVWSEDNPITRERGFANHFSVTLGPVFVF